MLKRLLTLMLSLTLVFSVGCAGGKINEEGMSKETAKNEEEILELMAIGGSDGETWMKLVEDMVTDFNSENDHNAKIEVSWYENEQYKAKFATLMTQNDMSDIFYTWEYGFLRPYAEAGKVYDMTDALEEDVEWKSRFEDELFIPTTYNGRIYALSSGRQMAPIYYNKQIFAENNVTVPETWDEFMEAIKTFRDADITPIVMASQDPWVIAQFFLDITGGVGGSELYEQIQSGETDWTDPRYRKSGELLQDLVQAGAFPENFSGLAYNEGLPLFTSEKAAMFPMGTWMTASIIEGMDAEKVGAFLPPAYDTANNKTHLSQVARVFGISETCENKEAAMAFLKMFSEDNVQEKMITELGLLPATKFKIASDKIDPVTAEIINLAEGIEPLTPFDVLFGANVGGEFNNIALAIATGKDPGEQFELLQAYTEAQQE